MTPLCWLHATMRTATRRLRRMSLGLLCDLAEHALEIGAWLFGLNLARHVHKPL